MLLVFILRKRYKVLCKNKTGLFHTRGFFLDISLVNDNETMPRKALPPHAYVNTPL